MKKLVGITGSGMIGRDPWDKVCWSGSANPFFTACKKMGFLEDAFGVEANQLHRLLLIASNMNPKKTLWNAKFNLDVGYYKALTKAIKLKLANYGPSFSYLQLGAIYNVTEACGNNTECYSYNDGNLACMVRSPYFEKKLLPYTKKALAWEKEVNQNLTKIFTLSDYLKHSFIQDYNIPEARVVSLGVGLNCEIPDASVLEKEYSQNNIVFIGVDFYRKGGALLVDAFNQLTKRYPNAKLHILGPKRIPDEIKNANNSNILFHGYVPRESMQFKKIMQEGTIAVLPSQYEPFGIALIECMSYGMPGIATNDWAFPEIVTHGENGLLVNKELTLADALDFYLSDVTKVAKHGKVAREKILERYGWDKVAMRLKKSLEV